MNEWDAAKSPRGWDHRLGLGARRTLRRCGSSGLFSAPVRVNDIIWSNR